MLENSEVVYSSIAVPTLRTINVGIDGQSPISHKHITIELINNWDQFIDNLEKIILPDHLGSALRSSYLTHLLCLEDSVSTLLSFLISSPLSLSE